MVGAWAASFYGICTTDHYSWTWYHWSLAILQGGAWVLNALFFPETLFRRDSASRQQPGFWRRLLCFKTIEAHRPRLWDVVGSFYMLKYPSVLLVGIYNGITFGSGIALMAITAVLAFRETYSVELTLAGVAVAFLSVVAATVGQVVCGSFSDELLRISNRHHDGYAKPEARLWGTAVSSFLVVAGLTMEGLCLGHHAHWLLSVTGRLIATAGLQIVSIPMYPYLFDCFPGQIAEISAIINFVRLLFSSVMALYMASCFL